MSYPREVWISEEEVLIALYYEWNAQADIVAGSATLSATGAVIDGQTVSPGNKVLITNMAAQSGLYLVPESGSWTLVSPGQPQVVFVKYGTTYANTKWNMTGSGASSQYVSVASTYYDPTAVRTELYCQNLSVDPRNVANKFRQPGALYPDINLTPDGIGISCDSFYSRKAEQWSPYLDVSKKFRFEWSLVNPRYSGSGTEDNDDHVYRNCSVTGQKITRQDNNVVEVALQMEAEYQE